MKKRGVFGSKKAIGSVLLLEAMQLLAVGLIMVGSLSYVNDKLDKVGFYKAFYARDFGIMTTAIYGAPGNVFQIYSLTPKGEEGKPALGFHFIVYDNIVRINASGSARQRRYWYFSDISVRMKDYDESFGETESMLKIGKEGNNVKMGKNIFVNRKAISCPLIDTEEGNWLTKKFIFDPAHGENSSDKGAVNSADPDFFESDVTVKIASNSGFMGIGNLELTREAGNYVTLKKREDFIAENADSDSIIISFHAGSSDGQSSHIKAYYNALSGEDTRLKSRKLGCLILNSIISNKNIREKKVDGIAVIPSESDYIKKIIPQGKVGVLLEIGNIQIPKNNNILSDPTDIAGAVFTGIVNYHET